MAKAIAQLLVSPPNLAIPIPIPKSPIVAASEGISTRGGREPSSSRVSRSQMTTQNGPRLRPDALQGLRALFSRSSSPSPVRKRTPAASPSASVVRLNETNVPSSDRELQEIIKRSRRLRETSVSHVMLAKIPTDRPCICQGDALVGTYHLTLSVTDNAAVRAVLEGHGIHVPAVISALERKKSPAGGNPASQPAEDLTFPTLTKYAAFC